MYDMTETNKLSSHQEEENKVTKQQTDKQEEIKKALTTDYY